MKYFKFAPIVFLLIFLAACGNEKNSGETNTVDLQKSILGKWVRQAPGAIASLTFKEDNRVEIDMMQDGSIEVTSNYVIDGNALKITDLKGQTCPGSGEYDVKIGTHYLGVDMTLDSCFGRVRTIMGFWTRPNYKDIIIDLDQEIEKTNNPELILERARVYVALGKAPEARADFEAYVKTDSTDAYVFMNLAGTCFPYDFPGVIKYSNKAIELDPEDKNSYFMRGLAKFEMGQQEGGCDDIQRAIDLGFNFIAPAISSQCNEIWEKQNEE